MARQARIAGVVALIASAGCGHGPRSVTDPDPSEKIPAIETAVRQKDRKAIPQLVKDLDSDDSAVRFYAIGGLRRLTGQDFGYLYYAELDQRKPAAERWKQWLARQERK